MGRAFRPDTPVELSSVADLAPTEPPIIVQSHATQAAEDRILAILRQPFAASFEKTSLGQALAGIARSTGLPIQVDSKALEEASISLNEPVSCDLSSVTLRSALDLILSRRNLTWIIRDECLLVTTPDKAGNDLVAKIYPVQDFARRAQWARSVCRQLRCARRIDHRHDRTDHLGRSGRARHDHFSCASGSLVISQTREVHEQIEMILPATAGRSRHARHHFSRSVCPQPPAAWLAPHSAARAGRTSPLCRCARRRVVAATGA